MNRTFKWDTHRLIHSTHTCMAGGGLRQPFTHQKSLKFGVESRPALNSNRIHPFPTLPKIPFSPTPRLPHSKNALDTFKQQLTSQGSSSLYYKIPLMIVEGRGQYLFDDKGHRYIDFFGGDGVVLIGHNHPMVLEAITHQASKLTHLSHHFISEESSQFIQVILLTSRVDTNVPISYFIKTLSSKYLFNHLLFQALLSKFSSNYNSVFLVNSESEAFELAFLMARLFTQKTDLLTLRGSYFGFTHLVIILIYESKQINSIFFSFRRTQHLVFHFSNILHLNPMELSIYLFLILSGNHNLQHLPRLPILSGIQHHLVKLLRILFVILSLTFDPHHPVSLRGVF